MNRAQQSIKRNKELLDGFVARAAAKNTKGVKEHGGGLQNKDTTHEIAGEIMDLVNYWVELEKQIERLVKAADEIAATEELSSANITELQIALSPFLEKAETKPPKK